MAVRDFMSYLIYVEHSAENLQFYLWYKDYVKRFSEASTVDLALAPEWTQAMEDDAVVKLRKDRAEQMRPEHPAAEIFRGTDLEKNGPDRHGHRVADSASHNPFNTPPRTAHGEGDGETTYAASSTVLSSQHTNYKAQAAGAFQNAGAKQPCKSRCLLKRTRSYS